MKDQVMTIQTVQESSKSDHPRDFSAVWSFEKSFRAARLSQFELNGAKYDRSYSPE